MFDFGFWELAIVLAVALLVVGPDKLPMLAAKIGRWVGKAKRMVQNVRSDIESEIKAAELKDMLQKQQNEISELRSILNESKTSIEQEFESLAKEEESLLPDTEDPHTSDEDENSTKPGQAT